MVATIYEALDCTGSDADGSDRGVGDSDRGVCCCRPLGRHFLYSFMFEPS
jgi:hypothetical protein